MMVMFQIAEEEENKVHGENNGSSNAHDLLEMMKKQFKHSA
jgi:hypothetical protein